MVGRPHALYLRVSFDFLNCVSHRYMFVYLCESCSKRLICRHIRNAGICTESVEMGQDSGQILRFLRSLAKPDDERGILTLFLG